MLNKKLLIAGIASLALIAGCSSGGGSNEDGDVVEIDASLPNGIWTIVSSSYLDNATGLTTVSPSNAGKVLITPQSITEYYDLDNGQSCDLRYTTKYDTAWNQTHQTFTDSAGLAGTASLVVLTADTMTASLQTEAGTTSINLTYDEAYTLASEYDLDQKTCGEAADFSQDVNGYWLNVTHGDPNVARERDATVLLITNYDGVGTMELTIHIDSSAQEGSCSYIEYLSFPETEFTLTLDDPNNLTLVGEVTATYVRVADESQAQQYPAC